MRLLWSLPKAAPAILRHLAAYGELVVEDLDQSQRDLGARFVALLLFGVCVCFFVLMLCLMVVALTWDTPHRVSAIGWMAGVFFVGALLAGLYRARLLDAQPPFLGTVRKEWAEDRAIIERILADRD